ncbi:hypothetical protein MLD38_003896 [Melastoma candidum]|uniref:Uncharacterized protein n=1 Tax=Melastoma candidum TaxID=119954 RepID=A0ACB9S8L5_9MYRT|nr:hypothetical protein MLD38_003896 [Melastoma candidum]
MGKILTFIGQDPLISREAGKFLLWLVPALLACAFLHPLVRYFQTQSLTTAMISSFASLCFHVLLCWLLVFRSGLHNLGAALATGISYWLNMIILMLYMRFSTASTKTRAPISLEFLQGIPEFFRFAVPSAVMIWTSVEPLARNISLIRVYFDDIDAVHNPFRCGSSRKAAHTAVYAVTLIVVSENDVGSTILFATRKVFGYTFSNENEVIDYVTGMSPLVCLSVIIGSLQGILSGVARGCGWQHIGAYINLGAYYLCGIPVAVTLAFYVGLRGVGLWIGIQSGAFVQTLMLIIITSCTNWEQQASKARERIFQGILPGNDGTIADV